MTLFRIRVVVFSILLCWLKLIGLNLLLYSSQAKNNPEPLAHGEVLIVERNHSH